MHKTQKYSFFVYFETDFADFETRGRNWELKLRAYIYNVTLKVLPAYLVDNNFFMSMQIQPRFGWFRMKLPSIQRVPRWIVVLCRDR